MSKKRMLGVWALLAVSMSLNGIFREAVLVRVLGRAAAGVASAASGIVIILAVTARFLSPGASPSPAAAARIGATWTALTLVFEFAIGRLVDRKSWRELFEDYAVWRGKLWPFVLLAVALAPFISLRRARPARSGDHTRPESAPAPV